MAPTHPHKIAPLALMIAATAWLALACIADSRQDALAPPEVFEPDGRDAGAQDVGAEDTAEPDVILVSVDAGDDAGEPEGQDQGVEPDAPPSLESGPSRCTDGIDNDGDDHLDCADFDCDDVLPCTLPEDRDDTCADGIDNDGDGFTDCVDFDCEDTAPCTLAEDDPSLCSDGIDNDLDNLTDCQDTDCTALTACSAPEDSDAACNDGLDNDGDGFIDCVDFGCLSTARCTREDHHDTCTDGRDNDSDGREDCGDSGCLALPACDASTLRVVTWNVQVLGRVGTRQFNAALAVLRRISADVVCFQEIEEEEFSPLARIASLLGYDHVFQGVISTGMAGGLTNACIGRLRFIESASRSSDDISTDDLANETGRDIVQIRAESARGARLAIFVVHLKSGFTEADKLRRAVEALRLGQIIAAHRRDHPTDAILAVGDFNEEVDSPDLGQIFSRPPEGLPGGFHLGQDLRYPIRYEPFKPLTDLGLSLLDATMEDSTDHATRIPSGRRIDFIYTRGLEILDGEVYDSCRDNGVDDPGGGAPLQKFSALPGCGVGEEAADHRPVIIDFALP